MDKMYIMSGDTEVAVIENGNTRIINEDLAPIYLKRTHNYVKWIEDRAIDPTRPNSRALKKLHGLSMLSSDYDTAMLYNAATITDNFWVRKSSGETWDSVRFKDDFYFKAAVSSDVDAFGREPSRSPELTNTGCREKGWCLIEGEWWLYKNEAEDRMNAEQLTYEIGSALGFDMAFYEKCDGLIRTKDFTGGIYNLQHIDSIVYDHDGINDEDIRYNYKTLNDISPELAKAYMDIKYLDALVNNIDRHTKNYGVLTSRETGEIVSLAPNYDNDMAFYGYPDILCEGKNRSLGEIRYFLDALRDIPSDPPKIDEKQLDTILSTYEMAAGFKEYILKGQELVAEILMDEDLDI